MNNIFQKIKLMAVGVWAWIKTAGGRLYVPADSASKRAELIDRLESHKTKIKLRKPKAKKAKKAKK